MPGYMKEALQKFQHLTTTRPQKSLHQWKSPIYLFIVPQLALPTENSTSLNPYKARNLQQLVGTFFYFAHAVDPKMIYTLNIIAYEQ